MDVSPTRMISIMNRMMEFQRVQNELRQDFILIYDIALSIENEPERFKPLIRACLRELFSLIDADLFLYNQWNPYYNYDDKERFSVKFKKKA
jgi:hypothetical protein